MPRKNIRAGQPNRQAQMVRRADRRETNQLHKAVRGPGSRNLVRTPVREKEDAR